jgi:hypothetical protein
MNYLGSCPCKKWKISVSTAEPLGSFNPRVCDCEYCQSHPSALISEPRMAIELLNNGGTLVVNGNGDALASFYHCDTCGELLAVGCEIDGQRRGAVNALLLDQKDSFGKPVPIQPRLLSAVEKLNRWGKLWGSLNGVDSKN